MAKLYAQKVLYRIERYIERFPDTEIWVLANKRETAKIYWRQISKNINTNHIKPLLISSRKHVVDGLRPENVLILVCGSWWDNPNSRVIMDLHFDRVNKIFPIDEIPYVEKIV